MKNKQILYKDYDGKIIKGKITHIAFQNKTKTITWYSVDFGYKAFMIPENEIIIEKQLELF
jgi:uncharacterized protein YrrD